MDRGPMKFTSDVSLPKYDKTAKLGEQIIALPSYKTHNKMIREVSAPNKIIHLYWK